MTELYRGLLLVLTEKFYELILSFRTHIQSFNRDTTNSENYFDVGILGFWNLMLEIVLTLFSLSCLTFGVTLVAGLAVIFYPCHAVIKYSELVLRNTRGPQPTDVPILKEKISDESPVIIKKNDKEKE